MTRYPHFMRAVKKQNKTVRISIIYIIVVVGHFGQDVHPSGQVVHIT